jgi:hypothetical protein
MRSLFRVAVALLVAIPLFLVLAFVLALEAVRGPLAAPERDSPPTLER